MKIKKIISFLIFISTFSLSYAQNIILNYGRSFSNITATDKYHEAELLDYRRINAPYYGISYTHRVWKLINLEIGLNYTEKGFKNDEYSSGATTYLEKSVQLNYLSIPIMIKVYNRDKSGEFYPFASFGIYKSYLTGGDYNVEYYDTEVSDKFIDNDWGLVFEAGVSYYNFEFKVGYSKGIKNISEKYYKENIGSVKKNNTIYATIGYNINL